MMQQHRPVDDDSDTKLFVGGLAWDSTEESIKEYFSNYGHVQTVNLKRNKEDPSKHRGFCFVKFGSPEAVDCVLAQKNPHHLDGSKIDPKSACPAGVKPEQRTKKIFVGGLQEQTTEERLMEYFGQFGDIQNRIEFAIDRGTQKKRGFCFIEFAHEAIVDRIVKQKFHEVAGKRLETKRALTKQQQAEEAARQVAASGMAHSVAMPTMMGAYGMQSMQSMQQNMQSLAMQSMQQQPSAGGMGAGQPVVYIHPDSLGGGYPFAAMGLQSYPGMTGTFDSLYQPYSKQQGARPAGTAAPVITNPRHTPYASKQKY